MNQWIRIIGHGINGALFGTGCYVAGHALHSSHSFREATTGFLLPSPKTAYELTKSSATIALENLKTVWEAKSIDPLVNLVTSEKAVALFNTTAAFTSKVASEIEPKNHFRINNRILSQHRSGRSNWYCGIFDLDP